MESESSILRGRNEILSQNIMKAENEIKKLEDDMDCCIYLFKQVRSSCLRSAAVLHLVPGVRASFPSVLHFFPLQTVTLYFTSAVNQMPEVAKDVNDLLEGQKKGFTPLSEYMREAFLTRRGLR